MEGEPKPQADVVATFKLPDIDDQLYMSVESALRRSWRGANSGEWPQWTAKNTLQLCDVLRAHPGISAAEWTKRAILLGSELKRQGRHKAGIGNWISMLGSKH